MTPPTRHGPYGWDDHDHRDRWRMHGALERRVLVVKGRRVGLLPIRGKGRGLIARAAITRAKERPGLPVWQAFGVLPLAAARTYEEGFPSEIGIPGFWDNIVPVSYGVGPDTIHYSTPQYGSEVPVLVTGCYTRTFSNTNGLEGPEYGSRSGAELTGQYFGDLGACLLRCIRG